MSDCGEREIPQPSRPQVCVGCLHDLFAGGNAALCVHSSTHFTQQVVFDVDRVVAFPWMVLTALYC